MKAVGLINLLLLMLFGEMCFLSGWLLHMAYRNFVDGIISLTTFGVFAVHEFLWIVVDLIVLYCLWKDELFGGGEIL